MIIEVLYKTDGKWPHTLDRVCYGPFLTRADALEFYVEGVKRDVFVADEYVIRNFNAPSYEPTYRESA